MSNIKFVKLVTGETVIGTYNEDKNGIEGVALIQVIPASSGIQIAIVPYGFPFEEKISGFIGMDKVVYEFDNVPSDLENKYVQAKSNITISSNMPGSDPFSRATEPSSADKIVDLGNLFNKN